MTFRTLLPAAEAHMLTLADAVQTSPAGIVSRTVLQTPELRVILFAFAEGQELTGHSSKRRAVVQILQGEAEFQFNGEWQRLAAGTLLHLPPEHPHAVRAAGGAFAFGWVPPGRLAAVAWVYGALAIGGGLSLCVLGMLCKILPFLVWMKAYGPRVGREPVPVATGLASRKLEYAWLWAHGTGIMLLAGGLIAEAKPVAAVGGLFLAAGVACYLANAMRVASHVWRNPEERRRRQHRTTAPALRSSL